MMKQIVTGACGGIDPNAAHRANNEGYLLYWWRSVDWWLRGNRQMEQTGDQPGIRTWKVNRKSNKEDWQESKLSANWQKSKLRTNGKAGKRMWTDHSELTGGWSDYPLTTGWRSNWGTYSEAEWHWCEAAVVAGERSEVDEGMWLQRWSQQKSSDCKRL